MTEMQQHSNVLIYKLVHRGVFEKQELSEDGQVRLKHVAVDFKLRRDCEQSCIKDRSECVKFICVFAWFSFVLSPLRCFFSLEHIVYFFMKGY
jgi:hypothetical protein